MKALLVFLVILLSLSGCEAEAEERVFLDLPEREATEHEIIYLAKGETYTLEASSVSGVGNLYSSEDEDILSVSGNTVTALSPGKTAIENSSDRYVFEVSDLYTPPAVNHEKEFLPCRRYSEEEAEYIDKILAYEVEEAGPKTRAAAVAAARFLLLRFPYKLSYFYENGRLNGQLLEADGEGRYYHRGLYLFETKKEEITASVTGPEIWGCPLYEYERDKKVDNGLDCSGFISWVLLNAGYDTGDIGAGPSNDITDLTDLGEKASVKDIAMEDIRTGDLVGLEGHIGIIIGMDEEYIYIGEAYWVKDLQVRVYTYEEFLTKAEWDYVIRMDTFYKNDGNLKDAWE
ncbi:MAG: hypothetical protein IIZ33_00110 [Erysipelotrichaceae bacterium]|nr:hypothetical protein [Erysipelotrichaceae bacterium]